MDDQGSIPGRGKICPSSTASRPDLRPVQPPIQWVPAAISSGVTRPGREAEVKNGGAMPPLPHMSWHSAYFN
jgi:hypothetical protein